ncbi:MAG: peptide chain release factor N(5)-glutamine methyltransferase [Acidobacteria bacterium]|nr:peptide chain release factor N(5)-glutamine methyltransferase [Acidobacteriota bacterium]
MSVREALREAEERLEAAGVETPRPDSEWLAAEALGVKRAVLAGRGDDPLGEEARARLEAMVARRARREPLAYIVGTVGFRGIEVECGPGSLVPRPETEITAGRAIELARDRGRRPTVVDVGAGCGVIALAVAAEVPGARVFATERHGAARGWALRNLARTGLRVTLLPGDLLEPLHPALGGCVDVIASNPPYLSGDEVESLPDEVRRYEPREALVAGPTGLEVILDLLEEVPLWLAHGGWLVLEVAPHQAERVTRLLATVGYDRVTVTKDLVGRDRVVEGRWTGVA